MRAFRCLLLCLLTLFLVHFAVCQPVYSLVLSVLCLRIFCFCFQLSPLSYFLCCIVPLCHCSASLCFCYPSFCLLYHFMIQYLLTYLPVFSNYFDFSFFIFNIYTYYGMVGCMTYADALLDPVVCVCVPFSDLYLFKIGIGMRFSLIIVCICCELQRVLNCVPWVGKGVPP